MQKTGSQDILVDYRDRNHPLTPIDLETQVITKHGHARKTTLHTIIGAVVFVIGLVAAFLVSMKVSHSRSVPLSNLQNADNPIFEWHQETKTTTVVSISTATPQPTTLTRWITATPILFAPQSPTSLSTSESTPSALTSSTSSDEPPISTIEPIIGTGKSDSKCLVVDSFGAKDICEYHCIPMNEGKAQHCDLRNGRWSCIRCGSV